MKYFALSDEMGTMWVDAETFEEAQKIADEEGGNYTIKEITKEEYDEIMREFDVAKQISDEIRKEYDMNKMSVREYSKIFKEKKNRLLKASKQI